METLCITPAPLLAPDGRWTGGSWLGPADEPLLHGMQGSGPVGLGELGGGPFRKLGGMNGPFSGFVGWMHPDRPTAVLNELSDMRARFLNPTHATAWIAHRVQTDLKYLPLLPSPPIVGEDCHAFGGRTTRPDGTPVLELVYLFRVGSTVVCIDGEGFVGRTGPRLTVERFAEIAERARRRVATI